MFWIITTVYLNTIFRRPPMWTQPFFLEPMISYLPPEGVVWDVGCGSGRDLRWLKQRGFRVVGLERSPGLARRAAAHAGCRVIQEDFGAFDFFRRRHGRRTPGGCFCSCVLE